MLPPGCFRATPQTRAILNRYGLRVATCPPETDARFARVHCVAPQNLTGQIRAISDHPGSRDRARRQPDGDPRPRLTDAIYRPFFLAGMAVVLTAGAAWGVLLLWKIGAAGSFTGVRVREVNAHGQAQVMGWVGLFIMGFAYQAFPRMWRVGLPAPRLALAVWLATLLGIASRSTAMLFGADPWAPPVHTAGVVIQVGSVGVFVTQISLAFRRSRQPLKPYVGFIFAAMAFMLIQAIYSGWHSAMLMSAADRDSLLAQIGTFQAPLRDLQIHGMAMLMIFGVALRMFPVFFGVPEVSDRRGWWALAILIAGVVLEIAVFLAFRLTGVQSIAAGMLLPWLALPIGAGLLVVPWRLWRPIPEPWDRNRSGKFVRVAFAWLFVSLTMLLLLPLYQIISGLPFSHAYHGAVRHAITVGFVSMMIVGMSSKVVPTLRDIDRERLPALWTPFVLINAGCLLRVFLQILTDWHAGAFLLVGISGLLEWLGLAVWAAHLSAVMLGIGRYRPGAPGHAGSAPSPSVCACSSSIPATARADLEHLNQSTAGARA